MEQADEVIEFGPFRLEPKRRRLTRSGDPVALGDRGLDILVLLIDQAPNLVTGDALLEQVWPGIFVDRTNLRFQIARLRKALGDGEAGNRYISTVIGRGYCFVAPLTRSTSGADCEPDPRRQAERVDEAGDAGRAETNLSHCPLELVGRDRELLELGRWLGCHHLVTLVGPGGVGKTRLAMALGWRALADFPAGVWLIDLASLTDPETVAAATAAVLQVSIANADAIVETIASAIGKGRRLLIFDNCEHLVEAAASLIKTLLERVPDLSVLATSQGGLHLRAEQLYEVKPLAVPPAGTLDIAKFGAVELFVARARAADRQFELHEGNSAGIGEICRHLDGLPLALEMAAARLRMFGVDGLCRGLDDRLKMLKRAGTGEARHPSLRAVVEWSHGLLGPCDQKIFRRLAVFPGSFLLDAAVAVAAEAEDDSWDVVDALGRLIDRSLVTHENCEPRRYRLLETLRLYATEQLRTSGETELVAERHARHFLAVFERADSSWEQTPDPDWVALYQPEIDNLRAALDWALAKPDRRQMAIALAASGSVLLHILALFSEGRKYTDRVAPLVDQDTPRAVAALLMWRACGFWRLIFDPRGLAYAEQAATLYCSLDDPPGLGGALSDIAAYHATHDRPVEARALLAEAERLLAGHDRKKSEMTVTNRLGIASLALENIAEAKRHFTHAVELARAMKSFGEPAFLSSLAITEYLDGNIERAIGLGDEALSLGRLRPGTHVFGDLLCNLARFLIDKGEHSRARLLLEEAFSVLVTRGNYVAFECLQLWAVLAACEGRLVDAAQLNGFADADRSRRGRPLPLFEQPLRDRLSSLLKMGLPSADLEALSAEGASWSEAEALEFAARRIVPAGRTPAARVPTGKAVAPPTGTAHRQWSDSRPETTPSH